MPIVVQHQPVGMSGLAAYATGFGRAQERNKQTALKYLTEQQRMQMDAAQQIARQKFIAGEAEKDRFAREFVPIGPPPTPAVGVPDGRGGWTFEGEAPSIPGPVPALPAPPVATIGPEGVPEASGAALTPLLPPVGPVGTEGVPETPGIVGVPSAPGASRVAPGMTPSGPVPMAPTPTAPSAAPFSPSATSVPTYPQDPYAPPGFMRRGYKEQLDTQYRDEERRRMANTDDWVKDMRGLANADPPKGMVPGSPDFKEYRRMQGALGDAVGGRKLDRKDPNAINKILEFRDRLQEIIQRNAAKTPADIANENIAYSDKSGQVFNEPGEGRYPGHVGPDGIFVPRAVIKDPEAEKAASQKQAALDKQRQTAEARLARDETRIQSNDTDYDTQADKDKAINALREAHDAKWGGDGAAAPDAAAPSPAVPVEPAPAPVAPPAAPGGLPTTPPPMSTGPSREAAKPENVIPTVTNPPVVNNAEEYARIPSGTIFIDRDGQTRRKR